MKNTIRYASFFSVPVLLLTLFTASVFAIGKPQNVVSQGQGVERPNIPVTQGAGKLKACQARENAVKTRMSRLTQLATNMETKFDTIASRVEAYYTSKVVPSGKTVPNYDSLVLYIGTKKTAVQTTLTKAQTDADNFSCASSTPKAQLTQVREDMQAVKQALKNFRTSIKNLIVAVHSVTGEENREGSPKPTK